MECTSCGITGCRPTDYAGWKSILGALKCSSCVQSFPKWMVGAKPEGKGSLPAWMAGHMHDSTKG